MTRLVRGFRHTRSVFLRLTAVSSRVKLGRQKNLLVRSSSFSGVQTVRVVGAVAKTGVKSLK